MGEGLEPGSLLGWKTPDNTTHAVSDRQQRKGSGGQETLPSGGVGVLCAHCRHQAPLPVRPADRPESSQGANLGVCAVSPDDEPRREVAAAVKVQRG